MKNIHNDILETSAKMDLPEIVIKRPLCESVSEFDGMAWPAIKLDFSQGEYSLLFQVVRTPMHREIPLLRRPSPFTDAHLELIDFIRGWGKNP